MQPNNHIGQYRIIKMLGKGGMGIVWLGEHVLLGRHAAIKTLLPNLSAQPEIVERFFNEARATAAINDPGVVQIHDFGYHVDGTAYIVMELLEGEALCDRMERLGPLPLMHSLRIVRQVAGALSAAHAVGIVHRDIKPENVFIVLDTEQPGGERAKLLDFGICKFEGVNPRSTETGTMLGTPVYMSPEQCRGAREVDERSDVYALGCVLFHMLTDRTPFEANGSGEYIVAHLNDAPPAPSTRIAGLTPEVDALVLRCMAKAPDERFQSMTELQYEIDKILATISDKTEIVAAPRALKMPSGFRSKFDANLDQYTPSGSRRETPIERPSPELRITRTPITVPSNRNTWHILGKTLGALGIAATAVIGGLFIYDNVSSDDTAMALRPADPVATTAPAPAAAPVEAPAYAPATVASHDRVADAPPSQLTPASDIALRGSLQAIAGGITAPSEPARDAVEVATPEPAKVAKVTNPAPKRVVRARNERQAPDPDERRIRDAIAKRQAQQTTPATSAGSDDSPMIPTPPPSTPPQAPSLQVPPKQTPTAEDLYDTR